MSVPTVPRLRLLVKTTFLAALALVGPGAAVVGSRLPADAETLAIGEALAIGRVGSYGRNPLHIDPIQHALATGTWSAPAADDVIITTDAANRAWEAIDDLGGEFFAQPENRQGYALVTIDSEVDRIMILNASGHGMVYVNGEPRCGDPYSAGFVHLPVHLRAGGNEFLFHHGRGTMHASLSAPRAPLMLNTADVTTPDLIVGEQTTLWAAMPIINATADVADGLSIVATLEPSGAAMTTTLAKMPPLSVRKVGFQIDPGLQQVQQGQVSLRVEVRDSSAGTPRILDAATISLRVRDPRQSHKRTFISAIDGSVQYYAVQPSAGPPSADPAAPRPALVLSLHGAAVEATAQADAYAPKDWCHIICPTNRRPFGFDWEDWGRLDALEVLEHAAKTYGTDPQRVYLTGHSMGGHGAWQLGALYPDRFAAIAPSAGWPSFATYTGAAKLDADDPIQSILLRAASPSDTLKLISNYSSQGVSILHGDTDDNVPVAQARDMVKRLAQFHRDFAYVEQPGAGHWWDGDRAAGTDCVDWPPFFELFQRRRIPASDTVHQIDFTTPTPGVSASCHWVTIQQQLVPMIPSNVRIERNVPDRLISGTTENVGLLLFDVSSWPEGSMLTVTLDDQTLENLTVPPGGESLALWRNQGSWGDQKTARLLRPGMKGPHRGGPFKDAFRHRAILVYGTIGTPEENAWSFAKARFDAETFWYRGNGSFEIMRDVDFVLEQTKDRNVILYGNLRSNAVWKTNPNQFWVDLEPAGVVVGPRSVRGQDLGCLFIQPRQGSDIASIAVVGGTTLAGMRAVERLPYFLSGVGYPDIFILNVDALDEGYQGVIAAGFFGPNWSAPSGEIAWRDSE